MSIRTLNRSFSGGEITPELFGRLDLSKVQESLALCMNFITLPHGPAVNRPGTEFVEEVKHSANPTRLIPFTYNNTQTFAIQLGAGYFRFHSNASTLQAGAVPAYVPSATVTVSLANPAVVAWNAHGLSAGMPVAFSTTGALPAQITPNVTYYVLNPTANSFQLAATVGGSAISTVAPTSTVTITIAAPGVITWAAHGLAAGDAVVFTTTGALPTGIAAGATYYVVSPTTNTFEIAATPGGTAIAITGTQSGTQTCTGTQAGTHTGSYYYSIGNLAGSGGVTYYCLQNTSNNAPPNAAYWYALPANGDYEIPNPYAASDLMDIHYTQSADVMTLVHPNYPILELRRYGAANWQNGAPNWQLVPVNFAPVLPAPASSAVTVGNPVPYTYCVVAFCDFPNFGLAPSSTSSQVTCSNDLSQPGAYNLITWGPVQFASSYTVYRISGGVPYYLGSASGLSFTDDGSRTPIQSTLPVAMIVNGVPWPAPLTVNATANTAVGTPVVAVTPYGSGTVSYSYVVTALDENSNESLQSSPATCTNNLTTAGNYNTITFPAVSGAIRYNVYSLSYGIYGFVGQVAPAPGVALSFKDNNITPDISRTPPLIASNVMFASGDYPAALAYYQQRRFFAGTANGPQNVWATRSGTEADLSYTIPVRDDNRLAFRIAARDASAIRHIVPLQDLLFLSASCEWRCSASTGVLTPATINVQPQSYIGANNVMPVVVGNAVLYAAARGGHIRQINYNWQINGYQSTDSSIFAPHLFDYNTIADMAYCRGPIPVLWCVSSSGKLLGMTYLPEQQIAAWHQHATGAADVFESICTISENNEDMLYCIVNRNINGASHRFVERLHTRLYNTVADCHYVDCGATFNLPSTNTGTFTRSGTAITCSISQHGLTSGQSYWFSFSDSTFGSLPGGTLYAVTVLDANTFTIAVVNAGSTSGTVTFLPDIVTGLTWLNGMTVNILADGAVMPQQTVTGGAITLPVGASQVHVGLPLTAQLQTTPASQAADPAMGQGLAKNVNKVFLRTYRSSGILAGPDFGDLTPYRQRSTENPGSPPSLVSDEVEILLTNDWGMSGQICIQQSDPLPLDIASMTLEIAVGGGV